jgi:hypothetical protein
VCLKDLASSCLKYSTINSFWHLHVQEAKAKYAEMRRLDAEALQITRQLGCQQCMPEPATAAEAAASSTGVDQLDPAERAVFQELHVPTPWPAQQQQQQQGRVVSTHRAG